MGFGAAGSGKPAGTRSSPMAGRSIRFAALTLSLVALAACGAPTSPPSAGAPPSPPATAWDARGFEDLKLRYMSALDDRPADETAAAVDMERRLGHEATPCGARKPPAPSARTRSAARPVSMKRCTSLRSASTR